MTVSDCAICKSAMRPDVLADTFRCLKCGFRSSSLAVSINRGTAIDEAAREAALRDLRRMNYAQLLDGCADLLPLNATLLDVGCAHGWFLESAAARGLRVTGIEPDSAMAELARKTGQPVIEGYFPQAVPSGARYEGVTFNDVLEHLPDVGKIVAALPGVLAPGGVVVVSLPVSDGLIYRVSYQAARLGVAGPLRRLWQMGLPSPHLSYFSTTTLPRLFKENGFTLVRTGELEAVATEGLYQRIRYDRAVGPVKAAGLYAAARMLKLAVRVFPSDTQYFAFRLAR